MKDKIQHTYKFSCLSILGERKMSIYINAEDFIDLQTKINKNLEFKDWKVEKIIRLGVSK